MVSYLLTCLLLLLLLWLSGRRGEVWGRRGDGGRVHSVIQVSSLCGELQVEPTETETGSNMVKTINKGGAGYVHVGPDDSSVLQVLVPQVLVLQALEGLLLLLPHHPPVGCRLRGNSECWKLPNFLYVDPETDDSHCTTLDTRRGRHMCALLCVFTWSVVHLAGQVALYESSGVCSQVLCCCSPFLRGPN